MKNSNHCNIARKINFAARESSTDNNIQFSKNRSLHQYAIPDSSLSSNNNNCNVTDIQNFSKSDRVDNRLKYENTSTPYKSEKLLKTVMFTDIVESTKLAFELGDSEWINILQTHNRVIRANLEKQTGKVLQISGDSILMYFHSAAQAIDCARTIQNDIKKVSLKIRVGIHTGEFMIINDNNICGLTIHIASRITNVACANQIIVSQTVKDILIGSNRVFKCLGYHSLKGLPENWLLYSVS